MSSIFNVIPKDKLLHLVVGAGVAVLGFVLWSIAMHVPVLAAHPVATGISLAGCMAGAQKEANDRLDNLLMYHRGLAALHGVEWLDLLATWAGASAVAWVLVRMGLA